VPVGPHEKSSCLQSATMHLADFLPSFLFHSIFSKYCHTSLFEPRLEFALSLPWSIGEFSIGKYGLDESRCGRIGTGGSERTRGSEREDRDERIGTRGSGREDRNERIDVGRSKREDWNKRIEARGSEREYQCERIETGGTR
jgi:hypothetical protein